MMTIEDAIKTSLSSTNWIYGKCSKDMWLYKIFVFKEGTKNKGKRRFKFVKFKKVRNKGSTYKNKNK